MWKNIIKGRFLGHPIHPMLVHFPTALFTAGFLFDLAGLWLDESRFFAASFYVIVLGLAFGLAAGIFGMIDYMKLGDRPEAFRTASRHAGIQLAVLTTFGIVAGLKYRLYPDLACPDMVELTVMGAALVMMFVGNYYGGELVFTHKMGMDETGE